MRPSHCPVLRSLSNASRTVFDGIVCLTLHKCPTRYAVRGIDCRRSVSPNTVRMTKAGRSLLPLDLSLRDGRFRARNTGADNAGSAQPALAAISPAVLPEG